MGINKDKRNSVRKIKSNIEYEKDVAVTGDIRFNNTSIYYYYY